MPQLAPMPWVTLLILLFLFKSLIFTSLWTFRPPQFTLPTSRSTKSAQQAWSWSN